VLDIPFAPPPEMRRNFDNARERELAQMLTGPKVMHRVRLTNKGNAPLTTAPALMLREDKVLGQGLMTYTAVGSEGDLDITAAVDVKVKKTDTETDRVPNAETWQGDKYGRVNLAGTITLTNYRDKAVEVEVKRHVLGNVSEASDKGRIETLNVFEDSSFGDGRPPWWGWYSWPGWWYHFNAVSRVTWTVKLEPGQPLDLKYTWNYYWR
jgi:hypothetical protein